MNKLKIRDSLKNNTNTKKVQIMTDKVKGSSKYFPYTEHNFEVTGVDQEAYHRNQCGINELKRKREND